MHACRDAILADEGDRATRGRISVGLIFLVGGRRVAPVARERRRLRGGGQVPRRYWQLLLVLTLFGPAGAGLSA